MVKKLYKKCTVVVISALVLQGLYVTPIHAGAAESGLHNPIVTDTEVIWDCIYLGDYNAVLEGGIENENRTDPIRWRVLSVYENKATVIAEQAITELPYDSSGEHCNWEQCSLNEWLNSGYFLKRYFDYNERLAISSEVRLLSQEEASNSAYGFGGQPAVNDSSRGTSLYGNTTGANTYWWLSTPCSDGACAMMVDPYGKVIETGEYITDTSTAVRPVMDIYISSDMNAWKPAGTVTGTKQSAGSQGSSQNPTDNPSSGNNNSGSGNTGTPSAGSQNNNIANAEKSNSASSSTGTNPNSGISQNVSSQNTTSNLDKGTSVADNSQSGDASLSSDSSSKSSNDNNAVKVGMQFTVGNNIYKVISVKKKKYEIMIKGIKNKKCRKITINSPINYKGNYYEVTRIGKKFASGCKNVMIIINSKKIKKIDKKAFAGIKKVQISVLKSKLKQYSTMIKKAK